MSKYFKQNNSESTRHLYNKSLIYTAKMMDAEYVNIKNFRFAEKYLYGRVDRSYIPIEVGPNTRMRGLTQTNRSAANTFQIIDFVGKAFEDMSMQFRKKVMAGQIRADDPFLSTLEVQKAYQSPRTLFRNFLITSKDGLAASFRSLGLTFQNFDEFLVHLRNILETQLQEAPFTYSGFVKSRFCPMSATGLVIEIAKESCTNDEAKVRMFKMSPNWKFYVNACRTYGFSVDMHTPWRLVADIGSNEMLQYAAMNGYQSTSAILTRAYVGAHRTYYENFKRVLLDIYNATKYTHVKVEYCADGSTRSNVVVPQEYTMELLRATYPEATFLKLYMDIRIQEEKELDLKGSEKTAIKRDILSVMNRKGVDSAIDLFETTIAPTYDNSGSLTDRLYRVKVLEQERINVLSNT